jgi:hypothetical protein
MALPNYTKVYQRYVRGRKRMGDPLKNLQRGGFYQLVEYDYVDEEDSKTWSAATSPIIFILYVSGANKDDLVHCIKISSINPQTIKRLFTQMIDEKDGELDLGKSPKTFYDNKMKHMKFFAKNFYRTYKTSHIRRFIELDMDIEYLIPKSKQKYVQNGYRTYSKNRGTSKDIDVTPNNKTK